MIKRNFGSALRARRYWFYIFFLFFFITIPSPPDWWIEYVVSPIMPRCFYVFLRVMADFVKQMRVGMCIIRQLQLCSGFFERQVGLCVCGIYPFW